MKIKISHFQSVEQIFCSHHMYFFIARQHRNLKKLASAEIMLPEHAYASTKNHKENGL